ncbi:hypothetical protein LTR84_004116 [Exophiala bonariae]|uniref:Uncharacterized protein n=1 Tax=Exophiala bonariae TaxID=1690606 RepID=A0AAV9NA07_9EURO|nr:hypothetical protein LTR84_004116 [Exophiala bonariae]
MLERLLLLSTSLIHAVLAATTITTYLDSKCAQGIEVFTPPENGRCQENILGNYSSLIITNPTPSCNVNWHVNDYLGCAGSSAGQLQIDLCYDRGTLDQITPNFGQFTVDCDPVVMGNADADTLQSSAFSSGTMTTNTVTSTGGTPTSPTSTSSSGTATGSHSPSPSSDDKEEEEGLSTTAKAVLAYFGSVGGLVLTAVSISGVIWFSRKTTKQGERELEFKEEDQIRNINSEFRDQYRFWIDYILPWKSKSRNTDGAATMEAGEGTELQSTVAVTASDPQRASGAGSHGTPRQ